jgi:hypothetical protein
MLKATRYAFGLRAAELAEWTMRHLVNRTDAYVRYLPMGMRKRGGSNSYTAPRKEERFDGALTLEIIQRHYRGQYQGHLIGLHAIGKDNLSRWCVLDIDKHGDYDPATPEGNFAAADRWHRGLRSLGFHPLLLDSNGAGGFHLLTVFSEPIPSYRAFQFGRSLVGAYQALGLHTAPEFFPKQPNINANRPYGSWWRLPGRHHTREHRTRVWDGDRWLEGHDAIAVILQTTGDSPDLIPAALSTAGIAVAGRSTAGRAASPPARPAGE